MQTFRGYAGTVKISDAMTENKRGAPPTAQRASTRTLLSNRRTHALRDTLQRVAIAKARRGLLADLDAFYLDHRRCGDLRAGGVDRDQGAVVWLECACTARITCPIDAAEGQTA